MPIRKRLAVAIAILILTMAVYGTLKLYAPFLVYYIVEQTLIQKAPPGTDSGFVHERLQLLLSARATREARMEKLFRISAYLEKVQVLTDEQLKFLLGISPYPSD